jgi:O-antigen ligase
VTGAAQQVAAVLVALPAATVLVAPSARSRAVATAAVLLVTPAVLLAYVWDLPAFAPAREHAALTGAAAALALAAVAGGAVVLRGRPTALAVAVVLALPFRVPISMGGETAFLLVPLYLVIAAGGLAQIVALVAGTAATHERRPGALERLLAVSIVLYAVQATYTPDPSHALQNLLFFYAPFAVLFGLLVGLPWSDRLAATCAGVFVGLGLLFSVVGFVEYATRTVPWNDKLIESNTYNTYFRVNSLFYDPNVYGRFLLIAVLVTAAVLAWSRRPRDVVVGGALLVVLWAALLTTLSQSSLAALVLGLGVLAALRGHWRAVGAGACVLAVGAVALVLAAPTAVRLSSLDDVALREATSGRSDLISVGADLFADRPLAGWGSGSFPTEYRRHAASAPRDVAASHTIPITVAAEQGVLGLAVYVALLAVAIAMIVRRARERLVRAAVATAFVALVFHTFVYAAFLEDPLAWGLLAAGVAFAPERLTRPRVPRPGRRRP